MSLEKESLTHKIEDDLALRNRNWDKLTSHLAESANKLIDDSGTMWIRFQDGTQFMRNAQIVSTSNLPAGGVYNFTWSYPRPFNTEPYIQLTLRLQTANVNTMKNYSVALDGAPGTDKCDVVVAHSGHSNHLSTLVVTAFAMGRWK